MRTFIKNLVLLTFILSIDYSSFAQGTEIPINNEAYHIIDRLSIKTGQTPDFNTNFKYYRRGDVVNYLLSIDSISTLSLKDKRDIIYLYKDNNEFTKNIKASADIQYEKEYLDETNTFYRLKPVGQDRQLSSKYFRSKKPFLKLFYRTPANFLELDKPHFWVKANPILNIQIGKDDNQDGITYLNMRGASLRGGIDNKIFFATTIFENQARLPDYVNRKVAETAAIPGVSFWKNFNSNLFKNQTGYDYLTANGYVGANITKHIGVQFGYGKNRIGQGYRSLLLSDDGANYLYLKLNTSVWRFHYQNLFTELASESHRFRQQSDRLLPKKYMTSHHLSFDILPNLNIGIYEAVIFGRKDHFELHYLNPIIFYRAIEQAIGSPDNVLIGVDGHWNFLKRFQLYGQFFLDEFKFDELTAGNGWWANKFGIQAGAKYIDVFGIDHLDAQVEFNLVRPYTYTHRDSSTNYAHFNQPLGHQLGANFKEAIVKLRYQPIQPLIIEGRAIYADYGVDTLGSNWGTNILLPYQTREQDFNNTIGQGVSTQLLLIGLNASYQIRHNLYADFGLTYRRENSALDALDNNTLLIQAGIRLNVANQRFDF